MRLPIFIAVLTFHACALTAGEENPTKLLVHERTVYVPYEKLKETFEKEGRGVFLPYEEFVKLWTAAQPKEKPPEEVKPPSDVVITGGSYTGVATETAARFEVTYKIRALGKNWNEIILPLKDVAIETMSASDPLAVFAPKGDGYAVIVPKPGEYTLTLAFSVRVDAKPGQRKIEFGIPPTAISRLELSIPEKDLRVDVTPKMAATVTTPEGGATKVLAFVGNADRVAVNWMPPAGKTAKGEAIEIASQAIHVEMGERILRLDTAISYKIERSEEDLFRIRLPAEMRLLSVKGNNIREWNVDKDSGVLEVRLHSAVKDVYALALRFERILEKTPEKLDVPFPAAVGALREDGYVTLAHEGALRLRVENFSGLSQIDPRELPEPLRRPNLLASFRYLAQPLALALQIESVLPEIQSTLTAVTSLGSDDDTVSGWVEYQIAKVGIFTARLKFENRWEAVSVGDPQTVEDFQTAADGAYKILTVNLKNRALGAFRLPFKLTATGRAAPGQLLLEPVQVLDTRQDRGLLGISAPKAFKLTTVERTKMASANVQQLFATGLLAQLPGDFELPLAYSYNQQPASVKISVERRQTEIRVTGYHGIIVSEAGLELSHKLDYVIEYAGVDRLQFSMPSTLDDKLFDVKCPGFKEKKKTGEQNGRSTWEILLQDKALGAVPVSISHQENLKGLEPEKPQDVVIPEIRAEDVKTQQGFIAVRKESALEIEAKTANLEPVEGINLPADLHARNVYLSFRYFQPGYNLSLKLTRHVPLEMSSTVVDLARLTFVVSEERKLSVRAELWLENAKGEQYLELGLPKDASIRALAVNGVPLNPLQRKGGGTLVKLAAAARPFPVQLIYSAPLASGDSRMGWFGSLDVRALEVLGGVPVNKIEADVYVPEDFAYMGFSGTLHPRLSQDRLSNTLAWLESVVRGQRETPEINRGDSSRFGGAPPLTGAFTTEGKIFRFQTLAPLGYITLNYCDRKLFWLFDILVFVILLAAGVLLLRHKRLPLLSLLLAFILLPLCLGWLVTSDAGEPLGSWLAAGVVLVVVCLILRAKAKRHEWREARIAAAPDPFLEDAPEKPAPPAPSTLAQPDDETGRRGDGETKIDDDAEKPK